MKSGEEIGYRARNYLRLLLHGSLGAETSEASGGGGMCGPGQGWVWGGRTSMLLPALSRCRLTVGFHLDRAGSFGNGLFANSSFCPMMSNISGTSKQLNALLACDPKERHDFGTSHPSVVSQTGTSGVNVAVPGVRLERPDSHRP